MIPCGTVFNSRRDTGAAWARRNAVPARAKRGSADSNDGQITIPRIDLALDCGLIVNPDRVRAQFEGAAIMAISNALYSSVTAKQGRIEQSNFTDYLVARTDITPETHVHIVESSAPPAGVGEP